ncbi:MAG: ribosomal RNA small subunit methyltransferase A [Clostridiales bacterium]|nr:ribosomal RNA small subunit methyltransferase A [Clostridiales bacterium]
MKSFRYKQSLGQNFIYDSHLLHSLLDRTTIGHEDTVLEVGAGRGDLSLALAARCKQVVTIEIDERLQPVLEDRFSSWPSIRLVMGDAMALDLAGLMAPYGPFHIAANLPYYLTTPLLNHFFRLPLPPVSINVMVQKEAGLRVLARPGSPDYGPLAVRAAYWGKAVLAARVPAGAFTPPPKVDSSFLVIQRHERLESSPQDEAVFHKLVTAAFAMRRKTLANNLVAAFAISREQVGHHLRAAGLDGHIRGEALSLADFIRLSDLLTQST